MFGFFFLFVPKRHHSAAEEDPRGLQGVLREAGRFRLVSLRLVQCDEAVHHEHSRSAAGGRDQRRVHVRIRHGQTFPGARRQAEFQHSEEISHICAGEYRKQRCLFSLNAVAENLEIIRIKLKEITEKINR